MILQPLINNPCSRGHYQADTYKHDYTIQHPLVVGDRIVPRNEANNT